jgi:Cytochrome c
MPRALNIIHLHALKFPRKVSQMKSDIAVTMLFAVLAVPTLAAGADAPDGNAPDSPYYRVEDGKVDAATFVGWRLFHDTCVACHGVDATGTDRAPDLRVSIQRLSPGEFRILVLQRYLAGLPEDEMQSESGDMVRNAFLEEIMQQDSGQPAAVDMPNWEANPIVRDRIMALYAYLKARADGVLAPGHPGLLRD